MAAGGKPAVVVTGLKEASRALQAAERDVRRELPRLLKEAARPALVRGRAEAPVGGPGDPHRGQLAARMSLRAGRLGATLHSPPEYAGVVMFGRRAVVPPHTRRGAPVAGHTRRLTPNPFLPRVVEAEAPQIAEGLGPRIQELLDRIFPEG